jgi:hypothetical protein
LPRRRIGLVEIVACALLVWAAAAFYQELAAAARGRESDPRLFPSGWLLGGPQVEPLRGGLEALGHRLPRGATVVVDSQAWDHGQLHYLTMWCAYYLPRHHVAHRELLASAAAEQDHASALPVYLLTLPPRDAAPAGAVAVELPAGVARHFSVHRLGAPPADPGQR